MHKDDFPPGKLPAGGETDRGSPCPEDYHAERGRGCGRRIMSDGNQRAGPVEELRAGEGRGEREPRRPPRGDLWLSRSKRRGEDDHHPHAPRPGAAERRGDIDTRILPGEDRVGVLSRIGYFVESAAAYPNLTVRENLRIQQRLTGAPLDSPSTGSWSCSSSGNTRTAGAGRLSLGNKQRLSLARALMPLTGAPHPRRACQRAGPRGHHRDQGAAPPPRRRAGRDHLHVEPPPRRGGAPCGPGGHRARREGSWRKSTIRELRENGRLAIEIEVDDVAAGRAGAA